MSLIVEDGTGLSTAESYISVADASTYHSNRGNAAWAALSTDTIREQYLRKATDYMVAMYRNSWQGYKVNGDQALDWPRSGCVVDGISVDDDIVPTPIKNACAELALKVASGDLYADQARGTISETVGPISVTYDINSPQRVRYSFVEAGIAPFLSATGSNSAMMTLKRV